MPIQELILADTRAGLAAGLDLLSDLETVGVDVERADWDRYYRTAALIQVGGDGRVTLVDPLALDDLSALDDFLAGRRTILHALENDLGPLTSLGVTPPRIEDTAIAAAILGLPTGLEGLLRDLLGVELAGDKAAMQRAQWEARPLTEQMISYAAGDVADLPALWEVLAQRLEESGRAGWYAEELQATLTQPSAEERRDWSRLRGIGRLDPATRARARRLWEVREDLARSTDTAPARILGDKVLLDLAATPPESPAELGRRGVRRQAVRDFGAAIVRALKAPIAAESSGPSSSGRVPTDEDRALADRLRVLRSQRAAELGIDAGLLCPSRRLMGAVLAAPKTAEELRAALGLRSWQWEQVADDFVDAFGLAGSGKGGADAEEEPAR